MGDPYNWALGDLNWQAGWSTAKQALRIGSRAGPRTRRLGAASMDTKAAQVTLPPLQEQGMVQVLMVVQHLLALQLQLPHRDLSPSPLDVEVARSFDVGAELG